jgi:uncharacterized protein (TIGR02569 family)
MIPESVRRAFGVDTADVHRLTGGLGPAYRAGGIVLKPVDDASEAAFIADVMVGVDVDESLVRVSRPVRAADGSWVFDGWAAWSFLDGSQAGPHDWNAAALAIDALHDGLALVRTRSKHLEKRQHRWAVADRVAWEEEDALGLDPRVAELVHGMRAEQTSLDVPAQLIHGDLAGNLLFRASGPPGVIDFSPFRRPAAHAVAIYLVDVIGWHQGDRSVLELLAPDSVVRACLPRAAVFRLVALDSFRREEGVDLGPLLPDYERICATIAGFVGS